MTSTKRVPLLLTEEIIACPVVTASNVMTHTDDRVMSGVGNGAGHGAQFEAVSDGLATEVQLWLLPGTCKNGLTPTTVHTEILAQCT